LPFVEKRINEAVAFQYLALGVNNAEECFFAGIEELKPSEAFKVDVGTGALTKWHYYRLEANPQWERFDERRARAMSERVRELLSQAVRLRLRADVPVGSCLSGGMDSSSIVCLINEQLKRGSIASVGERQKVFTACYPGLDIDESAWAGLVVGRTQTDWRRTTPDAAALWQDLDELVYYQDFPFCSSSIYAQYRVMKAAAEGGVKVLLDGQGGDELFTGYGTYYPNYLMDLVRHVALPTLVKEFGRGATARWRRTTAVCW
jgi:asparagine synthase (glutamine-hydrolysing)